MNTLDLANYGPVIPVIVIEKTEDAVPMAEALLEGGIRAPKPQNPESKYTDVCRDMQKLNLTHS